MNPAPNGGAATLPSLEKVHAELGGDLFRFVEQEHLALAGVAVFRRDEFITTVSLTYNYFHHASERDLSLKQPGARQPADDQTPRWLRDWTDKLRYPLLTEVVRTWTADEFGGLEPDPRILLAMHHRFALQNSPDGIDPFRRFDAPPSDVMQTGATVIVDGIAIEGYAVRGDGFQGIAARVNDRFVSIMLPDELWIAIDKRVVGH